MTTAYEVKVTHDATGEVVKSVICASERAAERIEGGLSINLNHAEYTLTTRQIGVETNESTT